MVDLKAWEKSAAGACGGMAVYWPGGTRLCLATFLCVGHV